MAAFAKKETQDAEDLPLDRRCGVADHQRRGDVAGRGEPNDAQIAHIAYTILIGIRLLGVRNSRTVVDAIGYSVAIGIALGVLRAGIDVVLIADLCSGIIPNRWTATTAPAYTAYHLVIAARVALGIISNRRFATAASPSATDHLFIAAGVGFGIVAGRRIAATTAAGAGDDGLAAAGLPDRVETDGRITAAASAASITRRWAYFAIFSL